VKLVKGFGAIKYGMDLRERSRRTDTKFNNGRPWAAVAEPF